MKNIILKGGIIITPFKKIVDGVLFLKDKKIEKVIHKEEFKSYKGDHIEDYEVLDVRGNYIAPGFIDIHNHAANGVGGAKDSVKLMAELIVTKETL